MYQRSRWHLQKMWSWLNFFSMLPNKLISRVRWTVINLCRTFQFKYIVSNALFVLNFATINVGSQQTPLVIVLHFLQICVHFYQNLLFNYLHNTQLHTNQIGTLCRPLVNFLQNWISYGNVGLSIVYKRKKKNSV